jgi:hypothetical protein
MAKVTAAETSHVYRTELWKELSMHNSEMITELCQINS